MYCTYSTYCDDYIFFIRSLLQQEGHKTQEDGKFSPYWFHFPLFFAVFVPSDSMSASVAICIYIYIFFFADAKCVILWQQNVHGAQVCPLISQKRLQSPQVQPMRTRFLQRILCRKLFTNTNQVFRPDVLDYLIGIIASLWMRSL